MWFECDQKENRTHRHQIEDENQPQNVRRNDMILCVCEYNCFCWEKLNDINTSDNRFPNEKVPLSF